MRWKIGFQTREVFKGRVLFEIHTGFLPLLIEQPDQFMDLLFFTFSHRYLNDHIDIKQRKKVDRRKVKLVEELKRLPCIPARLIICTVFAGCLSHEGKAARFSPQVAKLMEK